MFLRLLWRQQAELHCRKVIVKTHTDKKVWALREAWICILPALFSYCSCPSLPALIKLGFESWPLLLISSSLTRL